MESNKNNERLIDEKIKSLEESRKKGKQNMKLLIKMLDELFSLGEE